jgi:large subunit ribosomal protein L31
MYRLPAVYRGRLAYKGRGRKPQIIREVNEMREGIHPNYYQAKVVCNCGNEFVTGSTKQDIHVEVCSKCHSFYTGQQKAAAARGRIDKFNRKYGINAQ